MIKIMTQFANKKYIYESTSQKNGKRLYSPLASAKAYITQHIQRNKSQKKRSAQSFGR